MKLQLVIICSTWNPNLGTTGPKNYHARCGRPEVWKGFKGAEIIGADRWNFGSGIKHLKFSKIIN